MVGKKGPGLTRGASADPATVLRRVTAQVDQMFDQEFRWPASRRPAGPIARDARRRTSRPKAARRRSTPVSAK